MISFYLTSEENSEKKFKQCKIVVFVYLMEITISLSSYDIYDIYI